MEQTGGLLGIDLFPLFPSPLSLARWLGSPPFLLGVIHPEVRDSGKWHGALDHPGPPPLEQSKEIQELFLVFISIVFSQPLRKICPKSHPQQPSLSLPSLLMFGP